MYMMCEVSKRGGEEGVGEGRKEGEGRVGVG